MLKKENKFTFSGFTLVELMVAITIISIISGVSIFGLTAIRQKAQDTSRLSTIRDVQLALEAYKSVNGSYPDSLTTLAAGGAFLNKVPSGSEYVYTVDTSNKKTYCFGAKNTVFKNTSQPDLVVAGDPKSWKSCRGPNAATLSW